MIGKSTILSAIDSYRKQDNHKAIGSGKWYGRKVVVIKNTDYMGISKWEVKELNLAQRIGYFLTGKLQLLKNFRKTLQSELKTRSNHVYTTKINDEDTKALKSVVATTLGGEGSVPVGDLVNFKTFGEGVGEKELASYLLDLNDAIMESEEDGREHLIGHLTAKIDVIRKNEKLFNNPELLAATFTCLGTAMEKAPSKDLITKLQQLITAIEVIIVEGKSENKFHANYKILESSTVAPSFINSLKIAINSKKADEDLSKSLKNKLEKVALGSAIKNSGLF